jgi:hypothetical protein
MKEQRITQPDLHKFSSSLDIVKVIESRRMSWIEHVARMKMSKRIRNLVEKLKGTDHLGDIGVNGRIMLK